MRRLIAVMFVLGSVGIADANSDGFGGSYRLGDGIRAGLSVGVARRSGRRERRRDVRAAAIERYRARQGAHSYGSGGGYGSYRSASHSSYRSSAPIRTQCGNPACPVGCGTDCPCGCQDGRQTEGVPVLPDCPGGNCPNPNAEISHDHEMHTVMRAMLEAKPVRVANKE